MISLFKGIKDSFDYFRFHSDSGVTHADLEDVRSWIRSGNCDLAAFPGEFDRVLKQVPNDLLKLRGIGANKMSARPQVYMNAQFAGARFVSANIDHIGDRFVRIHLHEVQLHLVPGDSGEIEKIVDQLALELDVSADHGDRRFAFFRL